MVSSKVFLTGCESKKKHSSYTHHQIIKTRMENNYYCIWDAKLFTNLTWKKCPQN